MKIKKFDAVAFSPLEIPTIINHNYILIKIHFIAFTQRQRQIFTVIAILPPTLAFLDHSRGKNEKNCGDFFTARCVAVRLGGWKFVLFSSPFYSECANGAVFSFMVPIQQQKLNCSSIDLAWFKIFKKNRKRIHWCSLSWLNSRAHWERSGGRAWKVISERKTKKF